MSCNHEQATYALRRGMWTIHCHACGADGPLAVSAREAERLWNERYGERPYRSYLRASRARMWRREEVS